MEKLKVKEDLWDIMESVFVPLETMRQSTLGDGSPRLTKAGKPVFDKLQVKLSSFLRLNKAEEVLFLGMSINSKSRENFFSLASGGSCSTAPITAKDRMQKQEKVNKWAKLSRQITAEIGLSRTFSKIDLPLSEGIKAGIDTFLDINEVLYEKPSTLYVEDLFDGHSLGSCMSHFNSARYRNRFQVYFYDEIKGLTGVVFRNSNGMNVGRCLKWTDSKGNEYYDRVYTIGGTYGTKIEMYLSLNGKKYLWKDKEISLLVKLPNYDHRGNEVAEHSFPYMDSLTTVYRNNETGGYYLGTGAEHEGYEDLYWSIQNTDDELYDRCDECENSGDLEYSHIYDMHLCENCRVYSEYDGFLLADHPSTVEVVSHEGEHTWVDSNRHCLVRLEDDRYAFESDCCYVDEKDGYVFLENAVWYSYEDRYILDESAVELYNGDYALKEHTYKITPAGIGSEFYVHREDERLNLDKKTYDNIKFIDFI